MAAFWREIYGPKAKKWVEGLCRPISHQPAQSGLHPTPVVRSFEASLSQVWFLRGGECSFSQFGTSFFFVVSWLIAMEGTSSEIATHPMQESFHQSQTIVEREEDEDVKVIEEPLKQKKVQKTSKGKMGKTVAKVEGERGSARGFSTKPKKN
jgi:hypothetical protein